MKLTHTRIMALTCPPGKKDKLFFGDDPKGIAVRVSAAARAGSLESKTYLVQYAYGGGKRRVALGACSSITLAKAINAAKAVLGDVAHGRDPFTERKEKALQAKRKAAHDAFTLNALVDDWEGLHLKIKQRPSYAARATRTIRSVFAKHLDLPASDLTRDVVVRAHDALVKRGAPIMAARAVNYGSALCGWAIKRGTLTTNPFADIPVTPATERERVLSNDELAAVWRATEGPGVFNAITRMLLLTGQRREEVGGMTWDEISSDGATWTLPASRAKNNVVHIVPLSTQAQAIIAAQPRSNASPLVFPGRGGARPFNGYALAKATLDKASGVTNWTLHDLRRTCATGLQKLGVRLDVTEAVLNHVSGSRRGIVSIYQKHDYAPEKRAALAAWGVRVEAIVEGRTEVSNVIPLQASNA